MLQLRKLLVSFCLLFLCNHVVLAYQTENSPSGFIKDQSMVVGYHYNFDEPNSRRFHLVEIGYQKSSASDMHGVSANWYVTTEFLLNLNSFLIGPKMGGFISFGGFVLGSEIIYYSDFRNESLRFVPYFGIGGKPFRLTINPHIRIGNSDFEPINRGSISLRVGFKLN